MRNCPPGVTEGDYLAAVGSIERRLKKSFAFGCLSPEDIRQECHLAALQALPQYDGVGGSRPLENYLYTAVKNRLINLRRNLFMRNDPPCRLCHDGREYEHPDGRVCEAYVRWRRVQNSKRSLQRPVHAGEDAAALATEPPGAEAEASAAEMEARIDRELPAELRAGYLRLRAGERVSRTTRRRLREEIQRILWRRT